MIIPEKNRHVTNLMLTMSIQLILYYYYMVWFRYPYWWWWWYSYVVKWIFEWFFFIHSFIQSNHISDHHHHHHCQCHRVNGHKANINESNNEKRKKISRKLPPFSVSFLYFFFLLCSSPRWDLLIHTRLSLWQNHVKILEEYEKKFISSSLFVIMKHSLW